MSNDADKGPLITWHHSLEDYFRETGEKANCLAWCHKRAEELYDGRKTFIDLPVIVLSAVTGFLSVGSQQIFQGWAYTPVVLGVSSLFVSVLNTVGSYFGWAKRQEGHRISSIQYSRLYRFLSVELGLPRSERQTPTALLKYVRDQIDRLQEISPLIPPEILLVFTSKFGKVEDIAKPEEANGLERITIYPADTIKDAPTPSDSTAYLGQTVRIQNLCGRDSTLSEASGIGASHPAGGRSAEGGQGGGREILRPVGDGHAEGDSNPPNPVLPRPPEGTEH
jgi:hypothetical protein